MARVLPAYIQQGEDGLNSRGSKFLKVESGKAVNIIPLTNLNAPKGEVPTGNNCVISYDQYSIWLDNLPEGKMSPFFPAIQPAECDPGRLMGLEPKFVGMMICVTEDEPDVERILRLTLSGFKELSDIEMATGGIKGRVIQYKKTGSGQATRYKFINTGRSVEVQGEPETDLTDHIGPTTREEIIELLDSVAEEMHRQHGYVWPPAGGDPCAKKVGKSKRQAPPPSPVDDDFEVGDDD